MHTGPDEAHTDGQPEDDELLDNDSDEARDFAALQEVG